MNPFENIQDLLRTKAELTARLKLIPYDGTVEVKTVSGKKYLYIRKREAGKVKSDYVGVYSEELHQLLLKNVKDVRDLKKEIRAVEKQLSKMGYIADDLKSSVSLNLDFARANVKSIIYDQAVLEGCATTFPDTENILENGKVNNVSAIDVQKILNLKHAWEFILDKDVIQSETNYYVAQYIARIINEGFFQDGGRIRGVPVRIGGTTYAPPLPVEHDVRDMVTAIVNADMELIDTAIELALFVMKSQIFNDGNKRTAIILANHFLIAHGAGLLVVPENVVPQFKKLLVAYYEDRDTKAIKTFLKEICWMKL